MIPNVSVKKTQVGAGAAIQSSDGILAVLASSPSGDLLVPGLFSQQGILTESYPLGPLPEYAAYDINVSGRPCLAMRSNASIAGARGTITKNIAGSASVTAAATNPYEHYAVQVDILQSGTVGAAGITYQYSLDGGTTVSAPQALGTQTTLTIPNSGVAYTLGSGGTLDVGDNWSEFTERPLLNNADVSAALAVLQTTRLPWEGVLIDCQYTTGTVGEIDTWLASLEPKGQFHWAAINTRFLTEPTPTGETPAAYAAAMATLTENDATNRMCVGADGGHVVSLITGLNLKRPTALALAAMAMSLTPNIGTDPSDVENGPVEGFQIDVGSNPNDWDEDIYQSLDSLRLVTLRSFAPGGPQGVYITNPNVLIPNGSNIVWLQYLRVLNKACSIAWQVLSGLLSKGVRTVVNQSTGALTIDPRDAQTIEALVNDPLKRALAGQVSGTSFAIDRSQDLSTPGTPINASVGVQGLFYIKGFNVVVGLVKSITSPIGGA